MASVPVTPSVARRLRDPGRAPGLARPCPAARGPAGGRGYGVGAGAAQEPAGRVRGGGGAAMPCRGGTGAGPDAGSLKVTGPEHPRGGGSPPERQSLKAEGRWEGPGASPGPGGPLGVCDRASPQDS